MSVRSAAIKTLKEAGVPLHSKKITKRIMDAGLWRSKGKTPQTTVSACLYSDIKKNGSKSPFVQVGAQTFALRDFTGGVQVTEEKAPPSNKEAAKSSPVSTVLSFTDCAQKVLEEFGNKEPMH